MYEGLAQQKAILSRHKLPLDIVIVTYNRLVYLQRCIVSLIASTTVKHRIFVIDDNSNDGTKQWLLEARARGWISFCNLNKQGQGTANNFNEIIDCTQGDWIMMCNDDFYFHRYWDFAGLDTINNYDDCGIVSFYDFTQYAFDDGIEQVDNHTIKVVRSGLGASFLNRELYLKAKKFIMPVKGARMGFFTTPFCQRAHLVDIERNRHYATIPYYASHMDLPRSRLCERANLPKYDQQRYRSKVQRKDRPLDNDNK